MVPEIFHKTKPVHKNLIFTYISNCPKAAILDQIEKLLNVPQQPLRYYYCAIYH